MRKRIGIIFGGQSAEHEVSLQSAKNVIEALDLKKYEPVLRGYYQYTIVTNKGENITSAWNYPEESFLRMKENGEIYWSESGFPNRKVYLKSNTGQLPNDLWADDIFGTNRQATAEINALFDENVFSYAKPELLMKSILDISTNEGELVLDFFAGSGATAAVAHKMNRQYIAIEHADYIHTITIPRLKKVLDGEQGGISKSVGWHGGGSFIFAEVKH